MATTRKQQTPRASFKVFDTKQKKYLKGARSKSTWTSRGWAVSAAEDFIKEKFNINRYGSRYDQTRPGRMEEVKAYLAENIEIHMFPIESAIVLKYSDILEEIAMEKMNEAEKAARKKELLKEKAKQERIKMLQESIEKMTSELTTLSNGK